MTRQKKEIIRDLFGIAAAAILVIFGLLFVWDKVFAAEGLPQCRGFDVGGCVRPQAMDNLPFEREDKIIDHYTFPEPLSPGERIRLWEWQDEINKPIND